MKYLACLVASLILVNVAEAKPNNNKHNAAAAKAAKAAQEKRDKERKERDEKNDKIKEFMDARDSNHDNSLSLEEFIAGESNKESATRKFNDANKNKDRALSKSEIAELLGL